MKAIGEWVVGYYLVHIPTDEHKIHYLSKILGMSTAIVDKKTVGQYTGLLDKNGKEIYEGDRWQRGSYIGIVEFDFSGWCFKKAKDSGCYQFPSFYANASYGEIIGNQYENPELAAQPKTA